MIARYWSARIPATNVDAYMRHFAQNVTPELERVPGFARADLMQRTTEDGVEIVVLSFWNSWEAIDAFARPDRDFAVVAPEAAALFTNYDHCVRHYEMIPLPR